MKKHNEIFGRVLRAYRKKRGFTQETLAFEAGLDRTYVSLLELGERSPTLDTITSLCQALEISLSALALSIESCMHESERDHA